MLMDSFAHKKILNIKTWQRKARKYATVGKIGIPSFCILALLLYVQLRYGLIQKCFLEEDFQSFRWPVDIEDFSGTVRRYIKTPNRTDFHPPPINDYHTKIKFLESPQIKSSKIGLLIIVKSATRNSKKRAAIRKTWGNPLYLQKTYLSRQLPTVVIFICGLPEVESTMTASQLFPDEVKYRDIILAGYHDTYENIAYKTLLALRWAAEHATFFKYLMIVDDDMYINPTNVIDIIADIPETEVQVVTSNRTEVKAFNLEKVDDGIGEAVDMVPLAGQPLIMGQAFLERKPFRNLIGSFAKWSLSLKEYPFDYFPPFIAGAATLFDKSAATLIYYGALFTKHFWLDDNYIGIIAYKMGIKLTNTDRIHCLYDSILDSMSSAKFKTMMAMHGLQCPEQLVELWHSRNPQGLSEC